MNNIRVLSFNSRSLHNKIYELRFLLSSLSFDIIAIQESWLSAADLDSIYTTPAYAIFRTDRLSRGGGVIILVRTALSPSFICSLRSLRVECIVIDVLLLGKTVG